MKVGILTFHRTTNYGATLQAYALYSFIKKYGHDVEIIDYYPKKLKESYFRHLYNNKFFLFNAIKSWKIRQFLKSKIKISSFKYSDPLKLNSLNLNYDLILCGSDEIWNINSTHTGFDSTYFLDFICKKNIRKVSYAPSFGITKELGSKKSHIKQLLNSFNALSVRDFNSQQIIQNQCNLSAEKVLDPTFLIDDYQKIIKYPKFKRKYMLVYGGLSFSEQIYVKKVAEASKLHLIAIGYPCKVADSNKLAIGIEEWLGYFANASYVFTNFYHGVVFSIMFKKSFNVFERSSKSIKVRDLLIDYGLEDRILSEDTLGSKATISEEFNSFHNTDLKKMIEKSQNFIRKQLVA